jgi:hypothetical protein
MTERQTKEQTEEEQRTGVVVVIEGEFGCVFEVCFFISSRASPVLMFRLLLLLLVLVVLLLLFVVVFGVVGVAFIPSILNVYL